uniref:Cationic amino acid transporter C-terminal domain-containing protein n=1 Tax=Peronospora matthiolae TaxID=2874970 RepID=A0AAV1TZI9_9STRA
MSALRLALWRKPLRPASPLPTDDASSTPTVEMRRTLGLFDLIMVGIGGTVGSGVFAVAGLIASRYAGPAAPLSWLLAGLGCLLSGLSFMELACLLPTAGSTYAYAYHALGELPALIAGFLLTLEYGVSSAGGARSWSTKVSHLVESYVSENSAPSLHPSTSPSTVKVDVCAGLLTATCMAVGLCGMDTNKVLVNVVTMAKITVVLFIIVVGLWHFQASNLVPFVPAERMVTIPNSDPATKYAAFGWPGVLVGASASFYGYIGYDEVCCLAGEAKDPAKNIPRAIVGTIVGAATLSILATMALVGMQTYTAIDADEAFGTAFTSIGLPWAASFVAVGEVLTMPITSFIAFLAQPRVQYAMAKDGLLPKVFADVDGNGTLFRGTLLSGMGATALALFVPFNVLWNVISLGILVAFNLTNSSLLMVRATTSSNVQERGAEEEATPPKYSPGAMIAAYLVFSFLAAVHWQKGVVASVSLSATTDTVMFDRYMQTVGPYAAALFSMIAIALMFALSDVETKQKTVAAKARAARADADAPGAGATDLPLKKSQGSLVTDEDSCRLRSGSFDQDNGEKDIKMEDGEAECQRKLSESMSCPEQDRSLCSGASEDTSESSGDTVSSSGASVGEDRADKVVSTFRAPFVPFAPCVAIFFNWFLFAQMDGMSVLLIVVWLLLAVAVYFGYSRHHSLAFQQTQYRQLALQEKS